MVRELRSQEDSRITFFWGIAVAILEHLGCELATFNTNLSAFLHNSLVEISYCQDVGLHAGITNKQRKYWGSSKTLFWVMCGGAFSLNSILGYLVIFGVNTRSDCRSRTIITDGLPELGMQRFEQAPSLQPGITPPLPVAFPIEGVWRSLWLHRCSWSDV